jgi:hypothetical protein
MSDGPEFNAGLKNAMKGKEGKFADMVADAPGMYDGLSKADPPTKEEKANSGIKPFWGIKERGVEPLKEDPDDWSESSAMHHSKAPGKFSMSKPAEKIEYIQSSSASPLSMKNRFNHANTKVTKSNVNSAMKDDAAHISYLKRDINYDNKHGGSNKQMTADEKHISKLAGDIKYDVKKKRKYDNV